MSPEEATSSAPTEEDTSASSTPEAGSTEKSPAESSQDATTQEGILSWKVFHIQLHVTQMINLTVEIIYMFTSPSICLVTSPSNFTV